MFDTNGDFLLNIMAIVFLPICIYLAWKTIKAGYMWLGLAISSTIILVGFVTLMFVDSSGFSFNVLTVYNLVIYNIGALALCYFSSLAVWFLILAIKVILKTLSQINNFIKPGNAQVEIKFTKKY